MIERITEKLHASGAKLVEEFERMQVYKVERTYDNWKSGNQPSTALVYTLPEHQISRETASELELLAMSYATFSTIRKRDGIFTYSAEMPRRDLPRENRPEIESGRRQIHSRLENCRSITQIPLEGRVIFRVNDATEAEEQLIYQVKQILENGEKRETYKRLPGLSGITTETG